MSRLAIIPAIIFGLAFSGGGVFFLSQTSLPAWQSWSEMQNWQAGYAKLLSLSGGDNFTHASYRYEFGGESFQSERVYVAEFSDNIGSYHADLFRQLRPYQKNGDPLPIWINPSSPQQAVIDRDMRWGLMVLVTIFCSTFILIGLVVVYASFRSSGQTSTTKRPSLLALRKEWKQKQKEPGFNHSFVEFSRYRIAEMQQQTGGEIDHIDWQSRKGWETDRIASDATRGMWFFWPFAILWNAVSTPLLFIIPRELDTGNYAALVALLFPLVGLFLIYKSISVTLEYRRFGKVLVEMDPYPGAIGGHVGGRIHVRRLEYRQAADATEVWVRLECVYSYVSSSGKNRSRRESIKWAEQGKPQIDNTSQGVSFKFRFDVPGSLPPADVDQSDAYHFWRVTVKADVAGIDLNRNFNIPVFDTGESSRYVRHDISDQSDTAKEKESMRAKIAIASGNFNIDGLSRGMKVHRSGNDIQLNFPMFRNRLLTIIAAVFAGGFGFASYSMAGMAFKGGLFGIFIGLFGLPFFGVALLSAMALIYLPLNSLKVNISPGKISVLRRLLFFPVYRRVMQHNEIAGLSIERSGSTGQGITKVEHFKLLAKLKNGQTVTIAEDLDGQNVAAHFRDFIAQRIGVDVE